MRWLIQGPVIQDHHGTGGNGQTWASPVTTSTMAAVMMLSTPSLALDLSKEGSSLVLSSWAFVFVLMYALGLDQKWDPLTVPLCLMKI